MRRFLHAWWPIAVVVLFTVTLVLQIPRKALFFVPVYDDPAEPFVSFVSLDDDAYVRLVSRIRMTWQMRGKPISGGIADSRTDAFDFSSPLPPPVYLPLRAVAASAPVPTVFAPPLQALLPPSLGQCRLSRPSARFPTAIPICWRCPTTCRTCGAQTILR